MLRSRGHSLEELRAGGDPLVFDPLTPGRFFGEQLQTPDGKVDCCPPAFADALVRAEALFAELEGEGLSRLKLVTRRDPYMHNSWYANVPVMKRGERDRNWLYVHPEDARERGLADGAKARLSNAQGALELEVRHDAGLMRGVVALTYG
jgi:formate dehydrogenase